MAKSGQARIPTTEQQRHLFQVIDDHRHSEKNAAIMLISFLLGLRAQGIALLQKKEVDQLNAGGNDFRLLEVMPLPAAYTKGADAMRRSKSEHQRKTLGFDIEGFNRVVRQVEALAQAGAAVNPETFYPPVKKHRGKPRDLAMVDEDLRRALRMHLDVRLAKAGRLKPSLPLFVTQKGGPYSPNTLQEHMALMLRDWAGVEQACSDSGRRSVITDSIHKH